MGMTKLVLDIAPYKATGTGEMYYKVMGKSSSQIVFIGNDGKTESVDIRDNLSGLAAGNVVYIDDDFNIIKVLNNEEPPEKAKISNFSRGGSMSLNKLSKM